MQIYKNETTYKRKYVNKELKPAKHNLERMVLLIFYFADIFFSNSISTLGIKN
jgi:hypothetical protein